MFERFTDRARRVVVLAQEEARMLNHNYIGTEHVLLGLIHEGDGVAAEVLENLGIQLETVRNQVEEIIGQGDTAPSGHIPFTPRAKKVLELSLRESLQLGHNYIGTEHILLGLLREGEGVAAQILQKLGADLSRVRQHVIAQLASYAGEPLAGRRRRFFRGRPRMHPMEPAAFMEAEEAQEPGLERLADDVLRALLAARAEVRRLGAAEVGPEHLLAGLLAVPGDAAGERLVAAGVTLDALRGELDAVSEEPAAPVPPVPLLAADTWRMLGYADGLAGEDPVDSGVLLDALVARCSAVRLIVRAAGGDLERLRQAA